MYFLYLLILCYTSTLLPSVNTYVVLAANLDDFRSLAKKYIPIKNSVDQIKVMILETGHKNYNREKLEDDEHIDRTVEYVEDDQNEPYDVQTPVFKYQLNKPSRVSLLNPKNPSPKTRLATPKVLTLVDLVDKLKYEILQEIIDKTGDDNAKLDTQVNNALAHQLIAVVNKNVQNKPKNPMKVYKEEMQMEGTYEDTTDKDVLPQIHYLGQVQIPAQYLKRKPVKDASFTKKVVPKKHRFKSPKHFGAGKKVKYSKQVPVNSNKGFSVYLPKPSLVQQLMQQPSLGQQLKIQPSLGQQPSIVKQSILEPELSLMQQPSELQLPLDQQPSIIQQLAFMQQQIYRLNKIAEENLAKNKPTPSTTLESPELNAVEAPFEIISNPNPNEDEQETNDSREDHVQVAEDTTLSEEITIEPVTETRIKALSSPTTVENEQFIEEIEEEVEDTAGDEKEHTAGTVEYDDKATEETTHEKATEANSKHEEEKTTDEATTPAEAILVKADTAARLTEVPKIHTQEFGNPAAGEPIVEKTYNFNVPIVEPNKGSVNSKLPVDSARKVMLF